MPANGKVLIEVKGLRKAFGDNEVLKGIDTTVCEGEDFSVSWHLTSPPVS